MSSIIIDSIELVNETVTISFEVDKAEIKEVEISLKKFTDLMVNNHEMYDYRLIGNVNCYEQTALDEPRKLIDSLSPVDFFEMILHKEYLFVCDVITTYLKHNKSNQLCHN